MALGQSLSDSVKVQLAAGSLIHNVIADNPRLQQRPPRETAFKLERIEVLQNGPFGDVRLGHDTLKSSRTTCWDAVVVLLRTG